MVPIFMKRFIFVIHPEFPITAVTIILVCMHTKILFQDLKLVFVSIIIFIVLL